MAKFKRPDEKSIQQLESDTLKFWKDNDIFKKSVEQKPIDEPYHFYDGPPFISGLPHYGHLLGSIAKDIIPRYWTMKGKRVERLWGWDAHGLTVENKVQAKLGIKNRRDIENFGLEKFIEECYKYTSETSAEWPWYIDRIARWVDIDNAYKTTDQKYMESVMWVFKELYNKNLIYEGVRTSLYCTTCGTPVSNFEVAMDDTYKDVEDPAITVKFKLNYYKTGEGVCVVIFNEKNEILMAKRNEKNRDAVYGVVGGKKEESDKDLMATVKRECSEEIGVIPDNIEYIGSSVDIFEGRLFHTHHYKAYLISDTKFKSHEALLDLEWVKKDNIPWDNIHIPTKNGLLDVLGLKNFPEIKTSKPDVYMLAWTTTPWTIPSNRALVVDENEIYVTAYYNFELYILSKFRFEEVFKDKPDAKIYDEYKGKELVGQSYTPIYDFYKKESDNEFKVFSFEGMANANEGVGIVHSAPGFGDIDTKMGMYHNLRVMLTIDDEGKFIEGDNAKNPYAGMYYLKANPLIIKDLEDRNLLFKNERILHRFPYHDRCNTLLIQRAQSSWFIKVSELKDKLLQENENINWVPEHLKHGRFAKGVEQAPDWCISRNRFWATPMPVWESEDGDRIVVGSIKEIEDLSGQKVKDLHRPYIDEIVIKKNGREYKRRPEVLDSWMEAGSMPYGQLHYPFENKDKFEKTFPADYIIEYIGQVRAWFYVMHVLSVALLGKNSFTNVISTGVMSGNDGRKMSKTYGNYTDSKLVLETIGGDALRLYLMSSPLMIGDNANFDDKELKNKLNNVINPLWNTAKFFFIYADLKDYKPKVSYDSEDILDKWILIRLNEFINEFKENIEKYHVPEAVRPLEGFVTDLSTWYLRRSREKMQSDGNIDTFNTLYTVLLALSKTIAPITPFIAEAIYQGLKEGEGEYEFKESVHLDDFPDIKIELINIHDKTLYNMWLTKQIASAGNSIRKSQNIPVKQPLSEMYITIPVSPQRDTIELPEPYFELLKDELNVKKVIVLGFNDYAKVKMGKNLSYFDINLVSAGTNFHYSKGQNITVALDINITEELKTEAAARELIREIQKLRKETNVAWDSRIKVSYKSCPEYKKAVELYEKEIKAKTLAEEIVAGDEFKLLK